MLVVTKLICLQMSSSELQIVRSARSVGSFGKDATQISLICLLLVSCRLGGRDGGIVKLRLDRTTQKIDPLVVLIKRQLRFELKRFCLGWA